MLVWLRVVRDDQSDKFSQVLSSRNVWAVVNGKRRKTSQVENKAFVERYSKQYRSGWEQNLRDKEQVGDVQEKQMKRMMISLVSKRV